MKFDFSRADSTANVAGLGPMSCSVSLSRVMSSW